MLDLIQRFNVRFKVRFMLGISVRIGIAIATLVKTAVEVGDKSMLKFCPGAQMFGINLNYSKNCSSDKLRYCFHIQYSKKYKLHKDCHMPVFSDDFITVFHLNSVVPCVPLMPQINHSKLLPWSCVLMTAF